MKTEDFDYPLPVSAIAQTPTQHRDQCKLMRLDRRTGAVAHHIFADLPQILSPGDRLVFNDVKVIPARIYCRKDSTGARVELLLLRPTESGAWIALAKPLKRLKPGAVLTTERSERVSFRVQEVRTDATTVVEPSWPNESWESVLNEIGEIPLPPYIERQAEKSDAHDYQTVYARSPGAVAAPTAGLHFTPELLKTLASQGIDSSFLTLNIGPGTFRPVAVDDPREHDMHQEWYVLPQKTVDEIEATRRKGGRIVAVGTTTVRVLESCVDEQGRLVPQTGSTRLLILPGYRFRVIDALITNFHLPKSTLVMLVSAFSSREFILDAYAEAIRNGYRFFSYGDAMILI